MHKDRRIPTWLARRAYFRRIERWVRLGKPRTAETPAATAPVPAASNVVPFPIRRTASDRPILEGRRSLKGA